MTRFAATTMPMPVTLADVLIPKLRAKFADRGLSEGVCPCVVIPAMHPDFGDIHIYDDGEELTLEAGRFTHGHFSNWDQSLDFVYRAEAIADDVIAFLTAVFADEYAFWGSHQGSGGWRLRSDTEPRGGPEFVWSGPLR